MTSALPPDGTTPDRTTPGSTTPGSTTPDDKPAGDTPPRTATTPPPGFNSKGKVKTTRASGLWVGLITAAVLAIAFLIFIAQNSEKVSIKFLGFEGQLSLAIALLLSAVIGALVVAVPGIVRMGQLRKALRKNVKS